jgi:2-keto-3-deoxy-L-rhamnonate aldolase RhmA
MAQDPDRDENIDQEMVAMFSSSNVDAEMEANNVHQVLEASGIPSIVVGPSVLPSLEFQVQVPREKLEQARQVIAEAQAAGPAAAAEAEAATEQ